MNLKMMMMMNAMPHMRMKCGRFTGAPTTKSKRRGRGESAALEDLQRRNVKFAIREENPADVDQPDETQMNRWRRTRGSREGEYRMLLYFVSKPIVKYVGMRRFALGH
jgi:hypothetical protein